MQQEGVNPQLQRSAEDKGNQAAAKLEMFANTPVKSNQTASQAKNQTGATAARKSQGKQGIGSRDRFSSENPLLSLEAGAVEGEEPSLREVLQAVNSCKSSLFKMTEQIGVIREEINFLRHDVQKWKAALERRMSSVEDDLNPLKQEKRIISFKMEDMENRLRRNNVRILGLPERCEGYNPVGFMEKWLMETFGKESLPFLCNREST